MTRTALILTGVAGLGVVAACAAQPGPRPLAAQTSGRQCVLARRVTGYTSVNAIVKAEVFPASIRALGVGLGYAVANSMFGGTAPVIYQALSAAKQTTWFIVYVTAVIAVSLVVYIFFMKNRAVTALDREQGHAWGEPEPEGMRAAAR